MRSLGGLSGPGPKGSEMRSFGGLSGPGPKGSGLRRWARVEWARGKGLRVVYT